VLVPALLLFSGAMSASFSAGMVLLAPAFPALHAAKNRSRSPAAMVSNHLCFMV